MEPPSLKEQGYLPKRYVVAVMAFFGMMCNYMLRVNINLTIVAMVRSNSTNTTTPAEEVCGFTPDDDADGSSQEEGEFEWNEWTQGLITSSFFWGYVWTQVPGGRIAEKVGARRVFGVALTVASLLTLFIPLAARAGSTPLIVVRVLLGVSQGATFPSTHALLSSWAPPLERATLATIIYAGSQAGTVVAYPLSSAIIQGIGWDAVFYIQSGMALLWCLAWFLLVADTPHEDRRMTAVEKDYILATTSGTKDKKSPPVPVRAALTSLPFWSILLANMGNNWGFYTLLTDLPLYMKNMLMQDISSNAVLSAVPYLGMWIFGLIVSKVGDTLIQKKTLSVGAVRKTANSIAHIGPAVCLLLLTLVECDRQTTIAFLFVAVTLQGAIYTGFMVSHIDIAPNFAGTLYGITNAAATIPSWVAPMTVGALTNGQQTFEQWRKVFYIAAGIYVADALFFLVFSSGKVQSWNQVTVQLQEKEEKRTSSLGSALAQLAHEKEKESRKVWTTDTAQQDPARDLNEKQPDHRSSSHTNRAFHPD